VEGLKLTAASQRDFKGLQAELCVKAVAKLLAEHVPGEEIHDRHQIQKPLL
jgi:hypothetical protein